MHNIKITIDMVQENLCCDSNNPKPISTYGHSCLGVYFISFLGLILILKPFLNTVHKTLCFH